MKKTNQQTIKQLELKHIAPYYEYNDKCMYNNQVYDIFALHKADTVAIFDYSDDTPTLVLIEEIKPIRRPLSDLTKEIDIDGEKFIPALKLVELAIERGMQKDIAPTIEWDIKIINKPFGKLLKVTKCDDWYLMLSFNEPDRLKYFQLQKLFEWHFDIFNLIESGLAIDINTLNK